MYAEAVDQDGWNKAESSRPSFFWLFASGPKRPMKSQSPRVDAQAAIGKWIRWILVRCIQYYTYCRVENISLTSFKFLLRCFSCADHQSNVTGAERENALLRRPILLWFTTSWWKRFRRRPLLSYQMNLIFGHRFRRWRTRFWSTAKHSNQGLALFFAIFA